MKIDVGFIFNYLCGRMSGKYLFIVLAALLIVVQASAQVRSGSLPKGRANSGPMRGNNEAVESSEDDAEKEEKKESIPSIIKVWELTDHGSILKPAVLDTALTFYHIYQPHERQSFTNTFTGNTGGAYLTNDFFNRTYGSDFSFTRSFDAYWLTPARIQYFNTTTPYTVLDYTQSENRSRNNETRFNVIHSQNVNQKLNFEFIYNQTKSQGHYPYQENKFHNIGVASSYVSNNFLSHSNVIFNRLQAKENGGIVAGQSLTGIEDLRNFITKMDDAANKLQNNNFYTSNEYRLGKTIEADSAEYIVEAFIPRVGFIHELEFSGNSRKFSKLNPKSGFFEKIYADSTFTNDSLKYSRLTNVFQVRVYEAPDRKYTFGKRAYIGFDQLWYNFSILGKYYPEKQSNTFAGGGIFRNEGKFWQWEANGKIYLTGYRAGQTELTGLINKPLKIGNDTTSLRVEGSLKTLVPDYYDQYFYSNHFQWRNSFDNINELTIKTKISSQLYKASVGANYTLIGNYIYNNEQAIPAQAGSEIMVLSGYANKDFESKHWVVRTQLLLQKVSNDRYIHLPAVAGFISANYRTLVSKVLYFQTGIDARYNTSFYADAYQPGTSRFYLQNTQQIGNYPYVDVHVNMKLKRTRFFFRMMNVTSSLAGDNYYAAPDYPYYRRTFRIGVAWSFYD